MATTTIRVDLVTHAQLVELSNESGGALGNTVHDASSTNNHFPILSATQGLHSLSSSGAANQWRSRPDPLLST